MSKDTRTSVFSDKTLIPVGVLIIIVAGVISVVTWGSSLSAQVQANSEANEQQDKYNERQDEAFSEYAKDSKESRDEILRHILDIKIDVQDLKRRNEIE